jgi:hypothetical protein
MLCGEGNLLAPKNSKAWSLHFTWVCGGRLLSLSSKLRIAVGQQTGGFELFGAHKQQWPWGLLALGHALPGATAAASGMADPSLQVAKALRLAC